MRRSIEGWLILLLSAPLLLWGTTKISVFLFSTITQIPMASGKIVPSILELVFIWIFAAPVAAGAYHLATQVNPRKRRGAIITMVVPLGLLYALQVGDRLWQSLSARAWLLDEWLMVALLVGLVMYGLSILFIARKISDWQSQHG